MTRLEKSFASAKRQSSFFFSLARRAYLPPAPSSQTASARAGDNNAEADASKLPVAASSTATGNLTSRDSTLCRCGRVKDSYYLVCRACWYQTPPEIREQLKRGDLKALPKY